MRLERGTGHQTAAHDDTTRTAMAKPISFRGVYPILATPFHDDESLDLGSFDRLIRFMARLGVDGVTILGVLGEGGAGPVKACDPDCEDLYEDYLKPAYGAMKHDADHQG